MAWYPCGLAHGNGEQAQGARHYFWDQGGATARRERGGKDEQDAVPGWGTVTGAALFGLCPPHAWPLSRALIDSPLSFSFQADGLLSCRGLAL